MRLFVSFILMVGLFGSCLTDLRPKGKIEGRTRNPEITLLKVAKAHGYQSWSRNRSFQCIVQDSFVGWIGKKSSPFSESVVFLDADYKTGTGNGKLTIVSGEDSSEVWHYNNGLSYKSKEPQLMLTQVEDNNIDFWVPTYAYFIEFPFRILEADALEHLGSKRIGDKRYTKILASWNTVEPQKDIDQYLIYLDENQHIAWIEYTIRDQYPFLKGRAVYDYQKIDGVLVPKQIRIYSNISGKRNMLHQINISNFQYK